MKTLLVRTALVFFGIASVATGAFAQAPTPPDSSTPESTPIPVTPPTEASPAPESTPSPETVPIPTTPVPDASPAPESTPKPEAVPSPQTTPLSTAPGCEAIPESRPTGGATLDRILALKSCNLGIRAISKTPSNSGGCFIPDAKPSGGATLDRQQALKNCNPQAPQVQPQQQP